MKKMIRAVVLGATLGLALNVAPVSAYASETSVQMGNTSSVVSENTSSINTLVQGVSGQSARPAEMIEEIGQVYADELSNNLGASLGVFRLTAYCTCRKCSGRWGSLTASGTQCELGRTIAVDPRVIPLGTPVYVNIAGEGWHRYIAEDTGSGVKGNHIDVYAGTNHGDCFQAKYNCYAEVRLATR